MSVPFCITNVKFGENLSHAGNQLHWYSQPHLEYANVVWHPRYKKEAE